MYTEPHMSKLNINNVIGIPHRIPAYPNSSRNNRDCDDYLGSISGLGQTFIKIPKII